MVLFSLSVSLSSKRSSNNGDTDADENPKIQHRTRARKGSTCAEIGTMEAMETLKCGHLSLDDDDDARPSFLL